MITALALLLSLAGSPQPGAPDCPYVQTLEPGAAPAPHGRCRVVLYDPPPPRHVQPAPEPDRPCRVTITRHRDEAVTQCERIRVRETRVQQHERTVRAGDALRLDSITLVTLDGGVGASGAPVVIGHGGTVIVNNHSSASASASAHASARASAHFSVRARGGHGGHHGGGHHGGH